jgi:cytochrome d ubiquinol oxidase subunit II
MWLNNVWFGLFVAIVAGYLVLDGFDLGVGMLLPFVARDDTERRVVLNSIGPIWDGNEVWLVVGGRPGTTCSSSRPWRSRSSSASRSATS